MKVFCRECFIVNVRNTTISSDTFDIEIGVTPIVKGKTAMGDDMDCYLCPKGHFVPKHLAEDDLADLLKAAAVSAITNCVMIDKVMDDYAIRARELVKV